MHDNVHVYDISVQVRFFYDCLQTWLANRMSCQTITCIKLHVGQICSGFHVGKKKILVWFVFIPATIGDFRCFAKLALKKVSAHIILPFLLDICRVRACVFCFQRKRFISTCSSCLHSKSLYPSRMNFLQFARLKNDHMCSHQSSGI